MLTDFYISVTGTLEEIFNTVILKNKDPTFVTPKLKCVATLFERTIN